jgi:hypothetical protein
MSGVNDLVSMSGVKDLGNILFVKDLVNIILEYDGKIKYKKGKYINMIHKYDTRYNIIRPIINKKIEIMKTVEFRGSSFYFELEFDIDERIGLCYDSNFSSHDTFEICYYDLRNGLKQIRTYL